MKTMKRVTVYQAPNGEKFSKNMNADFTGIWCTLEELEPVVILREPVEKEDLIILKELFVKMNSEEYKYSKNYSMSIGDMVTIDDRTYRCVWDSWEQL